MVLRDKLLVILSVLCVSAFVCGCLGGDTSSSEVTNEEVNDPDEIWVQKVETSMEVLDDEANAVCEEYLNSDLEKTRAAKKVLVTHVNSLMSWSQSSYVTPELEDLKTEFEAYLENLKVVGQTSEFVVYHANREEWNQADSFAERFNGNLSSALDREKNIKVMLGKYRADHP
jgi:hypothetical protein